jgi:hypothetical protein
VVPDGANLPDSPSDSESLDPAVPSETEASDDAQNKPYTNDFYKLHKKNSRLSAKEIVLLILELIQMLWPFERLRGSGVAAIIFS